MMSDFTIALLRNLNFKFSVDEESTKKEFAVIRMSFQNSDEVYSFVQKVQKLTKTDFGVRTTTSNPERKLFRKKWICRRSRFRKKPKSKMNVECNSFIDVSIKRITKRSRRRDKFLKMSEPLPCVIKINLEHTHSTEDADDLRKLRVAPEVEKEFKEYFKLGLVVCEARRVHEKRLLFRHDPSILINSAVNPTSRQVYHMYDKWRIENSGSNTSKENMSNCKNETSVACSYCKNNVDSENIALHEEECMDKPIKCPECSDVVLLRNWYDHKCQAERTEGDNSILESSVLAQKKKSVHDVFLKQEDCDVIIKIQEREFPAHKLVLKAFSPVFASIFESDVNKKATTIVDVEDLDSVTFSDFLSFLYCGDVDILSQENVVGLFTAADKYSVSDLRTKCVEFMKQNLSVNTFCDVITLAVKSSESELITSTTDFFIKNAREIIATPKWQSFIVDNPLYCNKLFIELLASVENSNS